MSPLRRHPQQRRRLLPQLRAVDGPPRRSARRFPIGRRRRRLPGERPGRQRRPGPRRSAGPIFAPLAGPIFAPLAQPIRSGTGAGFGACPGRGERTAVPVHRANRALAGSAGQVRDTLLDTTVTGPIRCDGGGRTHRDPRSAGERLVSVATSPPAGGVPAAAPPPPAAVEACPLCGAPLHPEQEWCLRCGAAARTRLAASPNWKGPVATLGVVIALSLGVLTAALVKLAGGSDSTTPATTTTVTTSPAAVAPTPTTTAQGNILPGTSTSRTSTSGARVTRTATPGVAAGRGQTGTSTSPAHTVLGKILKSKRLRKVPPAEREALSRLGL